MSTENDTKKCPTDEESLFAFEYRRIRILENSGESTALMSIMDNRKDVVNFAMTEYRHVRKYLEETIRVHYIYPLEICIGEFRFNPEHRKEAIKELIMVARRLDSRLNI